MRSPPLRFEVPECFLPDFAPVPLHAVPGLFAFQGWFSFTISAQPIDPRWSGTVPGRLDFIPSSAARHAARHGQASPLLRMAVAMAVAAPQRIVALSPIGVPSCLFAISA